ncbi:unnamed protein product [Ixodes hexagonus]
MKVLCVLAVLVASASLVLSSKFSEFSSVIQQLHTPKNPVVSPMSYGCPYDIHATLGLVPVQPYYQPSYQPIYRQSYEPSYQPAYRQSYGGYDNYETLSFGKQKHHKHHKHGYGYPVGGHKTKKRVVYRERVYVQPKPVK